MKRRVKFYGVFARDRKTAGGAKLVKASSRTLTTKPGEVQIGLVAEIDDAAFDVVLRAPTLAIELDDVPQPKLALAREGA